MKLPVPSLIGQDTVIDFSTRRARASAELRDVLVKTNAGLAAGMTPAQIRAFEANRERKIIAASMIRLRNYTNTSEMVGYVEGMLVQLTSGETL